MPSEIKSADNLFVDVISLCNPLIKSAILNSTVLPDLSVNTTFFVVELYSPSTTTDSNGKSIESFTVNVVPSTFAPDKVITYVDEFIESDNEPIAAEVSALYDISVITVPKSTIPEVPLEAPFIVIPVIVPTFDVFEFQFDISD